LSGWRGRAWKKETRLKNPIKEIAKEIDVVDMMLASLVELLEEKGILTPDFSWYDEKFYHRHTDLGPENIPLYIENLSVEFIRDFIKKFNKIRYSEYATYADFIRFARRGLRKIPHQSLDANLRDISRFLSGFWSKVSR